MRILICEDDEAQSNWLASRLNHEGNFVQTTEQGDQALTEWQAGSPWDFVITDYCFVPGAKIKHGLDLVREIQLVDPSQRIIVQTGEWSLTVPPGVTLLRKPYPFHRLVRTMKGVQALDSLPLFRD